MIFRWYDLQLYPHSRYSKNANLVHLNNCGLYPNILCKHCHMMSYEFWPMGFHLQIRHSFIVWNTIWQTKTAMANRHVQWPNAVDVPLKMHVTMRTFHSYISLFGGFWPSFLVNLCKSWEPKTPKAPKELRWTPPGRFPRDFLGCSIFWSTQEGWKTIMILKTLCAVYNHHS